MGLLQNFEQPKIHEYTRLETAAADFFIPRTLIEIPKSKLNAQLLKYSKDNLADKLLPPSVPNIYKDIRSIDRFKNSEEIRKAISIPSKFKPVRIPDDLEQRIAEQSERLAVSPSMPISIDIGPYPLFIRSENENSILMDLWGDFVESYRQVLQTTTHPVKLNSVTDPVGETWAHTPLTGKTSSFDLKKINPVFDKGIELQGVSLSELSNIESSLLDSWSQIKNIYKKFFKSTGTTTWKEYEKIAKEEYNASSFRGPGGSYGVGSHRQLTNYSSDFANLEYQESRALSDLKKYGLTKLTPKLIADFCMIATKLSSDLEYSKNEKMISIPFVNQVFPEKVFRTAIRKIALELSYNSHYREARSPIRLMPSGTDIFSHGFERYGLAVRFPGSPKIGTLPSYETAVLVSSVPEEQTTLMTPITFPTKPTSTFIIERKKKRYKIPFVLSNQSFRDITIQ